MSHDWTLHMENRVNRLIGDPVLFVLRFGDDR
jgi:hypothetical protein